MQQQGGFTLVEIMVTVLMLGIATASLSSMFISIRNVQLQAALDDQATRAAQREIESLRNNSYSNLTAGQTISFTTSLPATLPKGTGSAVISAPTSDIRRIDATVTYNAMGKTQTVELSSLIGEIGITQ